MRRSITTLALALSLLGGGTALAHGTEGAQAQPAAPSAAVPAPVKNADGPLTVLINGVPVQSPANHVNTDGKTYVSVQAFAAIAGVEAEFGDGGRTAAVGGVLLADLERTGGVLTAWVRDLAKAIGAQSVTWDEAASEAYVLYLPKGSIQLDQIPVPKMGEHWANPQAGDMPTGPIYGVYKGKLVFLEYMIDQKDFIDGKNHVNLAGMKQVPMPSVVQTDIEFQPKGHPGMEIPHYDIHLYFISDEEQQAIH
ncbi:hypothetical protein [Gorillibacterium sp. sgz5001074]|uniref:hypothetical protein n=1 Tax=Gorillibacterium sp. sgz5001074 TaxID=3446695 RepID=UPI003F679E28